ncbi:Predicted thiol-disulfide oxidoreductase YuxK, DCC family [Alteromonadaceae bacterium Bs31]|nr:Predicted thiol-disulfide oxidoreductase YuxK, DCC family [Alteromonadaceae bacterium Bs31]
MLSIYYDSQCPLCVSEMKSLKKRDEHGVILLEDLHEPEFALRHPGIEITKALQVLHGATSDGKMLLGLDVSAYAWKAVAPKSFNSRLFGLLRSRYFRGISDLAYRFFARHRYTISFVFTGKKRCERCIIARAAQKDCQ